MEEFLIYTLVATLCSCILYGGYRLLMKKESCFRLNRLVLLLIVIVSPVIPTIPLPGDSSLVHIASRVLPQPQSPADISGRLFGQLQSSVVSAEANAQPRPAPEESQTARIALQILTVVYWGGISVMLLLVLLDLFRIFRLIRRADIVRYGKEKLVILPEEGSAWSFGRYIVISRPDFDDNAAEILTHEQAHRKYRHLEDLLLLTVSQIVFWFNPVLYFLKRDLREIHEFQADDYVLKKGVDAVRYQLLLIRKSAGRKNYALATGFSPYGQVKRRITMMNRSEKSRVPRWKALAFIPIIALLVSLFGMKRPDEIRRIFISGIEERDIDSTSIVGLWKPDLTLMGPTSPAGLRKFNTYKLITRTHFAWLNYDRTTGAVVNGASGTYTFDGKTYTENIEYVLPSMRSFIGKQAVYRTELVNGTMRIKGFLAGKIPVEEVWEKTALTTAR